MFLSSPPGQQRIKPNDQPITRNHGFGKWKEFLAEFKSIFTQVAVFPCKSDKWPYPHWNIPCELATTYSTITTHYTPHAPFYTPYFLSRHAVMTISKHTNLSISRLLSGTKEQGISLTIDNYRMMDFVLRGGLGVISGDYSLLSAG